MPGSTATRSNARCARVVPDGWTLAPQPRAQARDRGDLCAASIVPGEDGDAEHTIITTTTTTTTHDHGSGADAYARRRAGDRRTQRADAAPARARGRGLRSRSPKPRHTRTARPPTRSASTRSGSSMRSSTSPRPASRSTCSRSTSCAARRSRSARASIRMEHGLYPNPPPATRSCCSAGRRARVDVAGELVTPTAAAILTTLARPGRPDMVARADRLRRRPQRLHDPQRHAHHDRNRRRAAAARTTPTHRHGDEVVVLEANIDDMSPQHYELAHGAAVRRRRARRLADADRHEERPARRSRCRRSPPRRTSTPWPARC